MYYTYNVLDVDGDIHEGIVSGDSFVEALEKIDDYYDDLHATSVLLTCATKESCYDIHDMSDEDDYDDDEDEDDEEDYDVEDDDYDGNITIKAHTTVTPHIDVDWDEVGTLMELLKKLEN